MISVDCVSSGAGAKAGSVLMLESRFIGMKQQSGPYCIQLLCCGVFLLLESGCIIRVYNAYGMRPGD